MCTAFKLFVYIVSCCCFFALLSAQSDQTLQPHKLKNCTITAHCPDHSLCTRVHDNLSCICWLGYQQNPLWTADDFNDSDYCVGSGVGNKTVVVYTRTPPRKDHLAIGILLVLSGVIVITLILYGLAVLRPVKRTQAAYRQMQLRRSNHRRLEEFEDIDMTFHSTSPAESVS